RMEDGREKAERETDLKLRGFFRSADGPRPRSGVAAVPLCVLGVSVVLSGRKPDCPCPFWKRPEQTESWQDRIIKAERVSLIMILSRHDSVVSYSDFAPQNPVNPQAQIGNWIFSGSTRAAVACQHSWRSQAGST